MEEGKRNATYPFFLQMQALRFLLYWTCTLLQTCSSFIQYLHYSVVKDKEDKTPGAQCVQVQPGGLESTCCGFTLGSDFCKMLDTCGYATVSVMYCPPVWRVGIHCQLFGLLHSQGPREVVTQSITPLVSTPNCFTRT